MTGKAGVPRPIARSAGGFSAGRGDGGGIFLDDITLDEVASELGVPVIPIENDGGVLLDAMMD